MPSTLKFVAALVGCTLFGLVVGAGIVALWQRTVSIWPAIVVGLVGLPLLVVVVRRLSLWLYPEASPPGTGLRERDKRRESV